MLRFLFAISGEPPLPFSRKSIAEQEILFRAAWYSKALWYNANEATLYTINLKLTEVITIRRCIITAQKLSFTVGHTVSFCAENSSADCMFICDLFAAFTTAAVFLLVKTNSLAPWHLYILNALNGLMNTVQQPASEVAARVREQPCSLLFLACRHMCYVK